jgi:hydroxymethylpyrimidine pyrophosphatase-like HAD family hydrolase
MTPPDALPRMRPLRDWPAAQRARIAGVLTDIDDTLTTDGDITPDALRALADLRAAGLPVIAVTGRPVGWSEDFAATWPLDAVVAENGAVALVPRPGSAGISTHEDTGMPAPGLRSALSKRYLQDPAARASNFARMQGVLRRIVREVPGAAPSRDSPGRETDIAIDHSEFAHLPTAAVDRVVAIMRSEGMRATVSSIHVNGWYGDHDKRVGAAWIVRELLGRDLDAETDRWAYVGDSTNDERMFAAFPGTSVGVANIARFAPRLARLPGYLAQGERGAGFAEVARALLAAR